MQNRSRETILKIAVAVVVGIFLLDRMIISPAIASWKDQGERIAVMHQKVQRGRQLLEREKSLRDRWAEMQQTDLADDKSIAENDVFKAIGRWTRESGISFTSLMPQPRTMEGYETFECRASAVGEQSAIGRLLYEIETDRLPAHVEEFELTSRDAQGKQLGLSVRFSFVRLGEAAALSGGKGTR